MNDLINYFIKKIRKKICLYIIFIYLYKKFINIFFFIENNKYKFICNSKFIKKIIDVGSNNFQIAKLLLKLNKNVKVTCYDPIKISYKFKHANIAFNNYALFSKNMKKQFYVPYYKIFELSSLSSFYRESLSNYFRINKIDTTKIQITKRKVICRKLDNKNLNFQFLKIDAENSELEIIKGALNNIKNNNPIILLEKNKNIYKIKKILKKMKYKSFNYYNFHQKKFENSTNKKYKGADIYFLNKSSYRYI